MRIALINNTKRRSLGDDQLALLEGACKRVPGLRSKLISCATDNEQSTASELLQQHRDTIFVIPVEVPAHQERIMDWRRAVDAVRPLPSLCAFCFVLLGHAKLDPRHWLDAMWTDLLDEYSELALPSGFVVWGTEEQQLKIFRAVSALSSLARELESLAELKRLGDEVAALDAEFRKMSNRLED